MRPPSQDSPCSPGRPGAPCRGPARTALNTQQEPGGCSAQAWILLPPSEGSEGILTCRQQEPVPPPLTFRRPGTRGCPFFLLIQPAVPDGSPTSSLCLYPGALIGSSWPWPVPPGAMSGVRTKSQVPWPMRRPRIHEPETVHHSRSLLEQLTHTRTHIDAHTQTHTQMPSQRRIHRCTHTDALTQTHTQTPSQRHIHRRTHTDTQTHRHTDRRTHTNALTQMHSHRHTDILTQM